MKVVEQIIYSTLSGDSSLTSLAPGGVWRGVAPIGTTGVYVVFNSMGESDVYAMAARAYTESDYQIKAIAPGESALPAWNAAERIESLLTDKALVMPTGRLLACRRNSVISLTESNGGEEYQHAGGIYRITVQE
jgi:hypothetical protein